LRHDLGSVIGSGLLTTTETPWENQIHEVTNEPTKLDALRYLQHAGRECPVCHLEGVWQNLHGASVRIVNMVCLLLVPCHCTRCPDSHWVEIYRLVGVDWDATEAIATAKKTYGSADQHQQ
jgi:hypothetical protein